MSKTAIDLTAVTASTIISSLDICNSEFLPFNTTLSHRQIAVWPSQRLAKLVSTSPNLFFCTHSDLPCRALCNLVPASINIASLRPFGCVLPFRLLLLFRRGFLFSQLIRSSRICTALVAEQSGIASKPSQRSCQARSLLRPCEFLSDRLDCLDHAMV